MSWVRVPPEAAYFSLKSLPPVVLCFFVYWNVSRSLFIMYMYASVCLCWDDHNHACTVYVQVRVVCKGVDNSLARIHVPIYVRDHFKTASPF